MVSIFARDGMAIFPAQSARPATKASDGLASRQISKTSLSTLDFGVGIQPSSGQGTDEAIESDCGDLASSKRAVGQEKEFL